MKCSFEITLNMYSTIKIRIFGASVYGSIVGTYILKCTQAVKP